MRILFCVSPLSIAYVYTAIFKDYCVASIKETLVIFSKYKITLRLKEKLTRSIDIFSLDGRTRF